MSEAVEVRVAHHFRHATADEVFDAWITPQDVRRWMSHALTTFGLSGEIVRIEIDPRPGGAFLFSDMRDGEEMQHWGAYLTLKRPSVIQCTWFTKELSEREGSSVVRIEIAPEARGCTARLTHTMPASFAVYTERAEQGWKTLLTSIESWLTASPEKGEFDHD
ncbi:MAG: SRPBCC family protein [Gemmatimonadota bacterium]|nr:SRPBCC family protein [Gemmatimonadota bacterium]